MTTESRIAAYQLVLVMLAFPAAAQESPQQTSQERGPAGAGAADSRKEIPGVVDTGNAGSKSEEAGQGKEGPNQPTLEELLGEKAREVTREWEGTTPSGPRSYPYVEHHGYFRLRTEGFYRAHLGTQFQVNGTTYSTSGFLPPLTENVANSTSSNKDKVGPQGEDWIAGANMRFRYEPTLHVSSTVAIVAGFDILDNLVLGSTSDYDPSRPDAPLAILSRGQAPPRSGINGLSDSIAVKQAYLRWDILGDPSEGGPVLRLSAGRMARHWGLGILENDGEDLDADFGTYVDRVTLLTRIAALYFEVGYGWAASGPTTYSPRMPFQEPRDLTDKDDVTDITFAVFSRPLTGPERKARFRRLRVRNKPCLDYGIYAVYRRQRLDVSGESQRKLASGEIDPSVPGKGYDQIELVPRDAWTLTPDLWLRLEWRPSLSQRLRLELEAATVFGHVGQMREGDENSSMDIRSLGLAFEGEYESGGLSAGLHAGFASGDTAEFFGYLDDSNILNPSFKNPRLSAFYFNPDYHVDNLLFRRVIGTVTNAVYAKPFVQYDLFESEEDALAGRLEVMYARAIEKQATPGDDPNLGLEMNVKAFYKEKGFFYAGIEWAVLWPFGAFDLIEGYRNSGKNRSARWSTAVRAILAVSF